MSRSKEPLTITAPADGFVSTAIIEAIKCETDATVEELPPLYNTINPDSLNALFDFDAMACGRAPKIIEFEYAGHSISVIPQRIQKSPPQPHASDD